MKDNLTEMVFILDRSGSMSGLEQDTIGGYNGLLEKQKAVQGDATITTLLFDDKCETLHFRKNIKDISPITGAEYFVRGSTALLDAMGGAIDKIGRALASTSEEERPSKVMFVIITDGMENASKEFNLQRVKAMIEHQKSKYSWEFMFLGANIDAVQTARSYGISADRAVTYTADSQGTAVSYAAVTNALHKMRCGEALSADWKEDIERDTEARSQSKQPNAKCCTPRMFVSNMKR